MKATKINIHLKIASIEDIYKHESLDIFEFKLIFIKSMITHEFEGPYELQESVDFLEIKNMISHSMIYVIDDSDESDLQLDLIIREATADDIKINQKHLKLGLRYYLKIKNGINGPYFLNTYTKTAQLKADLDNDLLYIVAKRQQFQFINLKKTA